MTKRERLYPEIKRLREVEGLMWREIADRLGLSLQTAWSYYNDPTGERDRARKLKKARACLDCGKTINTDGRVTNPSERCLKCEGAHRRALSRRWILDSFAEWNEMFGAPPSSVDWNPAHARATYCAWKAERYERTGRPWPTSQLVIHNFGSWNAGLRAAGFTPLAPSEHWLGHAGKALRDADRAEA